MTWSHIDFVLEITWICFSQKFHESTVTLIRGPNWLLLEIRFFLDLLCLWDFFIFQEFVSNISQVLKLLVVNVVRYYLIYCDWLYEKNIWSVMKFNLLNGSIMLWHATLFGVLFIVRCCFDHKTVVNFLILYYIFDVDVGEFCTWES